jgi:hypothetical protein
VPSLTPSRIASAAAEPLGGPAFRTFARVADAWGLSAAEQQRLLGIPATSTFYRWRRDPPAVLPPDLLERFSYLFGIYKALHILLKGERADGWIRRPNDDPLFAGRPPLERMLRGQVADLYVVRQFLDWQRGGG